MRTYVIQFWSKEFDKEICRVEVPIPDDVIHPEPMVRRAMVNLKKGHPEIRVGDELRITRTATASITGLWDSTHGVAVALGEKVD